MSPAKRRRNQIRKRIGQAKKEAVHGRDQYMCVFCGSRGPLSVDHIVNVRECFEWYPPCVINHEVNLVTACFKCNSGRVVAKIKVMRHGRFRTGHMLFDDYYDRTARALKALHEILPLQRAVAQQKWEESQALVQA